MARRVTSAKWLSALLPMQKRATILDKNKKIRCDLRPTTAPNVDGTGIGFTFTSFYPNPTLSLGVSLSLSHSHPLCPLTLLHDNENLHCFCTAAFGCSNNLSLNYVKDDEREMVK